MLYLKVICVYLPNAMYRLSSEMAQHEDVEVLEEFERQCDVGSYNLSCFPIESSSFFIIRRFFI